VSVTEEELDGEACSAVVTVSLARDVGDAAHRACAERSLHPGRWLDIRYGSSRGPVDGDIASAVAFGFGRGLRSLSDRGVREAHLFLSVPANLAVLLGSSINAGPAMTLYHRIDGTYVPSVRLAA